MFLYSYMDETNIYVYTEHYESLKKIIIIDLLQDRGIDWQYINWMLLLLTWAQLPQDRWA